MCGRGDVRCVIGDVVKGGVDYSGDGGERNGTGGGGGGRNDDGNGDGGAGGSGGVFFPFSLRIIGGDLAFFTLKGMNSHGGSTSPSRMPRRTCLSSPLLSFPRLASPPAIVFAFVRPCKVVPRRGFVFCVVTLYICIFIF